MRGIAALCVWWLHAAEQFSLAYIPPHAYLAVDFFFCLSGFVVAYAYDDKLAGSMRFSDFAARRVIRLYPMILCGIVLGALVSMTETHGGIGMAIRFAAGSLILFPLGLLYHVEAFPINNPIWSLFFELFANAFYAIGRRFRRINGAWLTPLFLLVAAVALVAVTRHEGSLETIGLIKLMPFLGGFVRVAFPFLAGVVIYRYSLFRLGFALPSFLVGAALVAILVAPVFPVSWQYDCIAVIVLFPLLVILGANVTFSRVSARIWTLFGALSYPFYLVHQPVVRAVSHIPRVLHLSAAATGMLPALSLVLAVGCAYFAMKVYDEPVRAWLSSRRAGERQTRLVVEPARS